MAQFSKQALLLYIDARLRNLEACYRRAAGRAIDPGNGSAQVLPENGTEAAVYFGEWRALRDLARDVAAGEVLA